MTDGVQHIEIGSGMTVGSRDRNDLVDDHYMSFTNRH
jgi:hypothetical protein